MENTEEKMMTCSKCGLEKKELEGNMVLEGSAFCCTDCCGSPDDKKKDDDQGHEEEGVCEFC